MKISCYIEPMSTHSAKTAGRSAKAARRTVKKGAKSARATTKKGSKSARGSVGKAGKTAARVSTTARAPSAVRKPSKMIRTISPPVQPIAAHEAMMRAHKYQVGENVYYTSPTFGRAAASGSYTVVKLLPSEGDDYQYRIKSSGEAFERVAKESQLDRA
jgi:LmbE family N-acetylglucosaminyl deacetylase